MLLISIANHRKQTLGLCYAVNCPIGIKGGEIRDEGATGQGSKPKVGLCGFSVSNLKIDGAQQPQTACQHNRFVITTHIPISGGLLISPKIAQYIGTTKFIVKASSANGTLKHNI
jgi:hypothetical protein